MGTRHNYAGALFPAIGSAVLACLFVCPAPAGDNVQIVNVFSDSRGNQTWVEIDSTGERRRATPFVAVGDEGLRKVLENPDEKGSLAIPVPRLMRLVERARQALRGMKRPTANAPANRGVAAAEAAQPARPAGKPGDTTPHQAGPSAPPGEAETGIPPPDVSFGTATR